MSDDKAKRQADYQAKVRALYADLLDKNSPRNETESMKRRRKSRENAESHRSTYFQLVRMNPDRAVEALIELEASTSYWQWYVYHLRNEVGRLRRLVKTTAGIFSPRSKKKCLAG